MADNTGDAKYKFGSPEELANRHTDGRFGPTESSFTQIKPGSGGETPNSQKGVVKNNRATIRHRA